jgi:hypothetical protein
MFNGRVRLCPSCDSENYTLGSLCQSCGRSLHPSEDRSWIDALPLLEGDDLVRGPFGVVIGAVIGLINLFIIVLCAPYVAVRGAVRALRGPRA